MVKGTTLLLLLGLLISHVCNGMQMAARQSEDIRTVSESATHELMQKLLGKKYKDIVTELRQLSSEQQEFLKRVVHKHNPILNIQLQQVLSGHSDGVTGIAFSPDNSHVLTASYDQTARLWNLADSPATSHELTDDNDLLTSATFSQDGRFVLIGSQDATACIWDLATSPITNLKLVGHLHRVQSVAFSPDGRRALTGSWDKTVRLWDLTQSPIISQELSGHTNWVNSVAFSPDGRLALTGADDNSARLWILPTVQKLSMN